MQTAGAHELGYANAAILIALIDHLQDKGILIPADIRSILDDAIAALRPSRSVTSVGAAISFIEKAIAPQIIKGRAG